MSSEEDNTQVKSKHTIKPEKKEPKLDSSSWPLLLKVKKKILLFRTTKNLMLEQITLLQFLLDILL
jgi:hypothetical protein